MIHDLLQIPQKPKTCYDAFLFIQTDFLQHTAIGIASGVITFNMQRKSI